MPPHPVGGRDQRRHARWISLAICGLDPPRPLLPGWARAISQGNPILYMVNSFRYGFLGVSDVDVRLAFGIMVLFAVALYALAVGLMHKGVGIRE